MKKQYIYGFLIIVLIVIGYFTFTNRSAIPLARTEVGTTSQEIANAPAQKATLKAGSTEIALSFSEGESLYDALVWAKQAGLSLELKEYPGMGYFVTAIGSLVSTETKYLMYSVNGEEASVGISSYTLKPGDVIEWQLK